MRKHMKRILAACMALTLQAGMMGLPQADIGYAAASDSRILVDINAGDGRKASYDRNAENWILTSTTFKTSNGVTCSLSNGGSVGEGIKGVNCKILQEMSGIYPRLTMDGATIDGGENGGVLKLELKGLSSGTHTLKTYHSCVDNQQASSLTITVNGKVTATGVGCPTRVKAEQDAGISFSTFEVVDENETVTVLISPEGNGTQNRAWLNAFEIDGADPFLGVSNCLPADGEDHWQVSDGLSWTAGKNAASHRIYLGTSFDEVANADPTSACYRGEQIGTTFALDSTLSSIPTYYWRVDTVDTAGNVIKGAVYDFRTARLAFPTAEGYGRYARGGRGGVVVHVTNLNDSGEGSLRWALCDEQWQTADWKGVPRIVVFDVGGVIALESTLCIPDNAGNVYIAGQTAPGDGITLINYDFGAMGSSDVVIRDIRVRVGDVSGASCGGMGLSSCNHSIVDHCSISWATDEGFSSRSAQNITFQWNIIGESLHDSVHYNGDNRDETEPHAFAASIGGYTGSYHHNLLINCTGRNWSLAGAMEQDAIRYGGQADIRNNVVYNWKDRTTDGGVRRLNFVNNYYKAGAESDIGLHVVSLDGNELGTSDMQMMYVSGNVMVDQNGGYVLRSTDDAWAMGKAKSGGKNSTDADVRSDTPFFESFVNTQSAEEAYRSVLAQVGAGGLSATGRDYIDSRYISECTNTTYTYTGSKQGLKGIIDSQNDAGGYPTAASFAYSNDGVTNAVNDTDRDGMPNAWELEHGLNPNDPSDGAMVSLSADDYTNLELFLNELAGDPVAFNGTVTMEPIAGTLIAELLPNAASGWSIVENTAVGDMIYSDRDVTYAALPDALVGAERVILPCDAKNLTVDLGRWTAGADVTAYVLLDSRVTAVPAWLGEWTLTDMTVRNSRDVTYAVYAKSVTTGETLTLGTNGQSSGCVNYTMMVQPQAEIPDVLYGDVDCNGIVSVADAVLLSRYVSEDTAITVTDAGIQNADCFYDSKINQQDTAAILQFLSGIPEALGPQ